MVKTVETGKLAEFKVIEILVKLGFTVYIPVIDTGIDIVAEDWNGGNTHYFGIQVKSSRLSPKYNAWAWNVDPTTFRISEINYLVLVLEDWRMIPENARNARQMLEALDLFALVIPTEDFLMDYASNSRSWAEGRIYGINMKPHQVNVNRGPGIYLNKWI